QPPYDPIIFTSYRDDGPWGDTDGLGPSTGVSGDWQRVEITGAGNSSVIDGVEFLYGGSGGLGQLYANGTGNLAAPNVVIKNCHFLLGAAVTGIRTLNANVLVDSCSFRGSSPSFLGVRNDTPANVVIARPSWGGHASGPFEPSVADPCSNPGGLGVGVSDFVDYCPFLVSGAPVTDVPQGGPRVARSRFRSAGPVPADGRLSF